MTEFTNDFKVAFDHAMLWEVGKFWNSSDPDVISGKIDTKDQRRKVGYVNIVGDNGGETKYGIAQNANTDIDVTTLDLQQTMQIYYDRYWLAGSCDKLVYPLTIIHFDGCVNHGVGRANKFLQAAAGVTADGAIGPATLKAVSQHAVLDLILEISKLRSNFYNAIVERKPAQGKFLNGWMSRINDVTDYTVKNI